jgi:HAD superfamily hydrolase (TIGR01509 family)
VNLSIPAPSTYDAVIFDCDGTLVDSMPMHYDAWVHALRETGFPHEFTRERHHANAGMPIPATIAELNEEFGTTINVDAVVNARTAYVHAHHGEVPPIPEVVGFAMGLAGIKPMAVASGSEADIVEAVLVAHDLKKLFRPVVTPADVAPGRGKPAPDMFLLAAREMGIRPERCLVFEDGEKGIEAANAAGMPSVFVPIVS